MLGADRIDLAVLQGAQQLHLGVERQLADLVEEQRAAVGLDWNLPTCFSVAPVKAPFSWPNRMLSTRFSGMRAAIDGDEGLGRAVALALDGAGDQFLADAAIRPRSAPGWWIARRGGQR